MKNLDNRGDNHPQCASALTQLGAGFQRLLSIIVVTIVIAIMIINIIITRIIIRLIMIVITIVIIMMT